MSVSVIIPTRNQHQILDKALKSIAQANTDGLGHIEVIVIDNQSDELDSQRYLQNLPTAARAWGLDNVSIINFNETFNFSRMNNVAVEQARGDVLCFLNNDIEVISDDWLEQLVKEVTHSEIGCAGALLFYPNDTVQHAGVIMGMDTIAGHAYVAMPRTAVHRHPYFQEKRYCTAITGACLAIRRDVFVAVGGFECALAVAFNDVDLCLKVQQAGYKNVFLPSVQLYHHESISRGKGNKTPKAKKRHLQEIEYMHKIWGPAVLSDPYWISEIIHASNAGDAYTQLIKRRWRKAQTRAFHYNTDH